MKRHEGRRGNFFQLIANSFLTFIDFLVETIQIDLDMVQRWMLRWVLILMNLTKNCASLKHIEPFQVYACDQEKFGLVFFLSISPKIR